VHVVEARQKGRSGWRGPGAAFALSLAVHAGLVGAALWLFGSPTGAARGETRITVTLAAAPAASAAPAQAPRPVANAPVPAAPAAAAPPDAAVRAPRPMASASPAAVLASEAEAEDEALRRRPEALAARDAAGIAVPSHSQATPVAAAGARPAAARTGADASAQRGFVELHVLDWLAQHREYPRAARRAGLEGTVHVRFVIDPEGRIADAAVERSSGARVLDRAALELLGRASPVPGLAQFGLAQALELRLPIDYRLRRAAPAG
jgi:protein TonB